MPVYRALAPLCLLALGAGMPARAGGHFDVDDADTLDPGRCQVELWAGSAGSPSTGFQHIGPACRVGAVELQLNVDRSHGADPQALSAGPALKWRWLGAGDDVLRAAAEFGIARDLRRRGAPSRQWLLPLTWQPRPDLQVHANVGADWSSPSGVRTPRRGLAAEWAADERVSVIVERNKAQRTWTTRAGLRLALTPAASVDLSAARARPGGAVFVLGLNCEFGR